MLNLFCAIGAWLGRAAFVAPILLPVFWLYVYGFALVARGINLARGVR